jgi:hypothetical protein
LPTLSEDLRINYGVVALLEKELDVERFSKEIVEIDVHYFGNAEESNVVVLLW